MRVNDFIPELKGAIAELSDSAEVRHLAGTLGSAWTSSSEMLGEIGGAIRSIEAHSPELPDSVRRSFDRALAEVRKVWPAI
jgi:hypothetical protein